MKLIKLMLIRKKMNMNSSAVGRSDFGGTKSKKDIYNFHEVKIA